MAALSNNRLLAFARSLLPTMGFGELLDVAREELRDAIGYQHTWLMVADDETLEVLRMIDFSGSKRDLAWEVAPTLKVKGDKFLEAMVASEVPIVIPDARTDPRTNKQIVEQLQNRTLINVPLRLLDKPFGFFGIGTFGDEGCRAPSAEELDYLVGMASQIAVAAGRIRFMEAKARAERERADLERKLLQMQKLESLGLLAGGIAHDFNNLLTVILASASLAEQTTTGEARDDVRVVIDAAVRGRDLTRKLLAMSRQQDLNLKPIDLNGRLGDLLALTRRVLPETIQVELIKAASLPLIEGDGGQIDQVFINLFINARDAMAEGGRITLETEQVVVNGTYASTHPWAKPGRYVLATMTDTGMGMSRETLDRIFDPFFTTKGMHGGTGLGLAISYGIVRQHGGMLHCYSEPGVGTSFKVYFPALERLASTVGTKLVGAVPRGAAHERILIAEDDPGVRAVAHRILQQAGYDVTSVESGDQACDAASRTAFDLVVLDVVMPGMPCRKVVERLRLIRPDGLILLSSGYTAGTNVVELLRETNLELLRKPYDPDQLLFGVRRVLDGGGTGKG